MFPNISTSNSKLEIFKLPDTITPAARSSVDSIVASGPLIDVYYRQTTPRPILAPTLVKATSSPTGHVLSSFREGFLELSNSGWHASPDAALIGSCPFPPVTDQTTAIYNKIEPGPLYRAAVTHPSSSSVNYDFYLNRLFGAPYELQTELESNDSAWLSYDMSGVNTKKVFAYSLSMLDNLSGISGENLFSRPEDLVPVIYQWEPNLNEPNCSALALKLALSGCKGAEEQEEPDKVCLTGVVTDEMLKVAIEIARKKAGFLTGNGSFFSEDGEIIDQGIINAFTIFTGGFAFNTPSSGDSISFESYDGNYSGDYQAIYHSNPPYPKVSKKWVYGVDYTDIDSLVSALNNDLSGVQYQVWHDIDCLRQQGSGYFESGSLAFATKTDSNFIFTQALHIGNAGKYTWSFNAGQRSIKYRAPVLKYLLPTTVKLQGANVYGSWVDLDSHSNIDWLNIEPTPIYKEVPFPIESGNARPESPEPANPVGASGEATRQLIYTLTVTGEDKCEKPFSYVTEFYQTPSSSGCKDPTDEEEDEQDRLDDLTKEPETVKQLVASYLKTGWKFASPEEYNYYRVVLDDFVAHAEGFSPNFSNEFSISNVNFYGVLDGFDIYSGNMCLIGASYQVHIEGVTSGIITGQASGYASDETSGIHNFDNQMVVGIPITPLVKFNKRFGYPTTPFTGLLIGRETGIEFYTESVGGYFYDVAQQSIYFTESVEGTITGQGYLQGGPYNIVESGYLRTGISDTQFVVTDGFFNYSGFIPGVDFPFTNRLGFSYLSGSVTSVILSGGCVLVQATITGNVDEAWQLGATGYRNAVGVLQYNTPEMFDSLTVNGVPMTYATGEPYGPTSYYDNIDTLVNIINSGENDFAVRATKISPSLIHLNALVSGVSGNDIILSSDGSVTRPMFDTQYMVSGEDYFASMTPNSPFTGQLSMNLCAVGYFVAPASGEITGSVPNFRYLRTFTGIWNLVTGDDNFRSNGWMTPVSYSNGDSIIFESSPTYFTLAVDYKNDPLEVSTDLAVLTISGLNFGTGIQLVLSGKY